MSYNQESSDRLRFPANINPEIWDVIRQIGTRVSEGTRQVKAAMVIKALAMEIKIAETRLKLNEVGESLFADGVMAMSYKEDLWYCGTPYVHSPIPQPRPGFNNHANGPLEERFKEYLTEVMDLSRPDYYSKVLYALANVIKQEELSDRIRKIADAIDEQNEAMINQQPLPPKKRAAKL